MDIQFFEKPAPHFVIDNFLSRQAAKACLEEAVSLKDRYEPARVGAQSHLFDDCEQCRKEVAYWEKIKRQNSVVYLDRQFENRRNESMILRSLNEEVFSQEFKELMQNASSIFPIIFNVNHTESILSRYGKCDFYGWHTDNGQDFLKDRRIITLVYYFNKEPHKFSGGELCLAYPTVREKKVIEPRHNRLVVFVSNTIHCVNAVDLEGLDFDEGRFSINMWLGFKTAEHVQNPVAQKNLQPNSTDQKEITLERAEEIEVYA